MPPALPPEIGTTGLFTFGGRVDLEEWHRLLRGDRAVVMFGEMATDVVCGSGYQLLSLLGRQATTRVICRDDKAQQAVDAAQLLTECMDDMSHTWDAFMQESDSCIPYGWALHEIVVKYRRGPAGLMPSRFNDGRIGIAKLPLRKQETRARWTMDPSGDVTEFIQNAPSRGYLTIPLSRCLHFRMGGRGSNPEGYSFFRNAFVEYNHKKHVMQYEGIGVERDAGGMPDMEAPPEIIAATEGENLLVKNSMIRSLEQFRNHQQAYMLRPSETDNEGKATGYKFRLLGSPGAKQFDTDRIITRCNKLMALALNTEVQQLGMDKVGSFALADSKTNILGMAVGSILDMKFAVLNRTLVPLLMSLNGIPEEFWPRLEHSDIETPDPDMFMKALAPAVAAGLVDPRRYAVQHRVAEYLGVPPPEQHPDEGSAARQGEDSAVAIQRLMDARKTALDAGDKEIADKIAAKIDEILTRV